MKKALTIIAFLCLTVGTAQAQMWFAEGTKWQYYQGYGMGDLSFFHQFIVEGDSIEGGKSYKKLKKYSYSYSYWTPTDTSYSIGFGGLVRESNDSVFVKHWGNEKFIYNFNALEGDILPFPEQSCGVGLYLDSVRTLQIYGTERRMQYWRIDTTVYVGCDPPKTQLLILEGVGAVHLGDPSNDPSLWHSPPFDFYDAAYYHCFCDYDYEVLQCFHSADDVVTEDTCTFPFISSIADASIGSSSISPNPATQITVLSWQQPISGYVSVSDFSGKVVWQHNLKNTTTYSLDCSTWPQGLYLISLQTEGQRRVTRKVQIIR